jgi:putative peptidoglycan lipid II flippase
MLLGWLPWLAYGFILAWCVYASICFLLLLRDNHFGGISWTNIPQSGRLFANGVKTIVPLLPLPIFMQSSILLERLFSSLGEKGLVAAVDYARTISDSVMSVVAVPLGVLGLTSLAGLSARAYRQKVSGISELVLIFLVPASGLLFVVADPLVRVLFQRGAFDDAARLLTVSVLSGHAVGLAFQVLGYALSRALTADGRNRVVVLVTVIALTFQVAVQGIGVSFLGPLAIGLGPSVFGLVLTIGFAHALGQLGRIAYCFACMLPTVALVALFNLWHLSLFALAATLIAGSLINIWSVGPLRRRVMRHVKPMFLGLT